MTCGGEFVAGTTSVLLEGAVFPVAAIAVVVAATGVDAAGAVAAVAGDVVASVGIAVAAGALFTAPPVPETALAGTTFSGFVTFAPSPGIGSGGTSFRFGA